MWQDLQSIGYKMRAVKRFYRSLQLVHCDWSWKTCALVSSDQWLFPELACVSFGPSEARAQALFSWCDIPNHWVVQRLTSPPSLSCLTQNDFSLLYTFLVLCTQYGMDYLFVSFFLLLQIKIMLYILPNTGCGAVKSRNSVAACTDVSYWPSRCAIPGHTFLLLSFQRVD